jgi:hypothetical protein
VVFDDGLTTTVLVVGAVCSKTLVIPVLHEVIVVTVLVVGIEVSVFHAPATISRKDSCTASFNILGV